MRRFLIPLFSAVMTAAVSGAVALADPADPHVLDPCGDADVMVRVGDHVVGTPDPERAAGFDMKAAWFEDLYDAEGRHMGVRIHLRMCGDVPDPELMGSGWSVHWDLEGPCSRVVGLHDSPPPDDPSQGVVRRAYLQSQCARPGPIPGSVEVDRKSVV